LLPPLIDEHARAASVHAIGPVLAYGANQLKSISLFRFMSQPAMTRRLR
jgi:hypothetical protein